MNSFQKPYADAGHDVASTFAAPSYQCVKCKTYLIDLSEDLIYGEMRPCRPKEPTDEAR